MEAIEGLIEQVRKIQESVQTVGVEGNQDADLAVLAHAVDDLAIFTIGLYKMFDGLASGKVGFTFKGVIRESSGD